MKTFLTIILLSLSLSSCMGCVQGQPRWADLPIKIDIQNQNQQDAIDFYNNLFPPLKIFEASQAEEAVKIISVPADDMLEAHKNGDCSLVWDNGLEIKSGVIRLSSNYFNTQNTTKLLLAHELMHLLGYSGHDKYGLMMPKTQFFNSIKDGFGDNLRKWIIETYDINTTSQAY